MKYLIAVLWVALVSSLAQAATVFLTPNKIGGGIIPSGYESITFSVYDGNWTPQVQLPAVAKDNASITLVSSAGYGYELNTTNTDIPLVSLTIKSGDRLTFVFNSALKKWIYTAKIYSPLTSGAQVPSDYSQKVIRYSLADGNWASTVALPATAPNGAMVSISSQATTPAAISPQNQLYASSMQLRAGDSYFFIYRSDLSAWVALATPTQRVNANEFGSKLPSPVVPKLAFEFTDNALQTNIALPDTAGDRDRISVSSKASRPITISNTKVDFQGSMQLKKYDRYDFIYIKELNKWVLQNSPKRFFRSPNTSGDFVLPTPTSPVAEYTSADGAWQGRVFLPEAGKIGDQVIVRSNATRSFQVVDPRAKISPVTVTTGDWIRFVRAANSQWQTETSIITMLLVYSDQAAQRLGDGAMRLRLQEGLRLTNEALENSRANFYVKPVGFLRRELPGDTLEDAVNYGRTDALIQQQRNTLKADAVFYEGTEKGCGLAWIGPSKSYMLATGSLDCGTNVMRHEFGHNMGLGHDNPGRKVYARGTFKTMDVMAGNAIPYYSNPRLYSLDFGIPLGTVDSIDAVRALNEVSATVSMYK